MEHPGFNGFGTGTQRFLSELAAHNGKEWFKEHRRRYETEILEPAEAFVRDLGEKLIATYPSIRYGTQRNGTGSVMRIHRDVRFSPDKRPYKTNLGVIFWMGAGKKVEEPAFYFHVDPQRIFFYGGQHMFPRGILQKYREFVDDGKTGQELVGILEGLSSEGLRQMEEPAYKRVPRGYPKDHPRVDLLRLAGIGVSTPLTVEQILRADLVETCLDLAQRMKPLIDWIVAMNRSTPTEEGEAFH